MYAQMGNYRQLGLRERLLTLPLMVATVLTLIWRQVPSLRELTRMLAREDLLWSQSINLPQSSVSQRLLTFPYHLFERVITTLVSVLEDRFAQHQQCPFSLSRLPNT